MSGVGVKVEALAHPSKRPGVAMSGHAQSEHMTEMSQVRMFGLAPSRRLPLRLNKNQSIVILHGRLSTVPATPPTLAAA